MAGSLTKLEAIQAIYAQIPDIACKGYCHEQCGPIPVTDVELEAMARSAQRDLSVMQGPGHRRFLVVLHEPEKGLDCPLLVNGQCSVYESRPLICRLMGVTEGLPCRYGCKPERVMPNHEAFKLMAEVEDIAARETGLSLPRRAS